MARIGLVSEWASRLGGGVFEAVLAQADLIRTGGDEPIVFALHDRFSDADRHRFDGIEVITCPARGPRQLGYAPDLAAQLLQRDLDCLHLHGIWTYVSGSASRWAARSGRPYVISPHGMLDPWIVARGRAKKAIARFGYENASWRRASLLHALTAREAEDVERETGRNATVIIPNAVVPIAPLAIKREPVVAYIGRIHPKKNLAALIEGWQAAAPPGARLEIAGWGDDADVADLRHRIGSAGKGSILFHGPMFGEDKVRLLRRVRFLALPSFSEGLPMAVLEAWSAGTPTLISTECNLPEGFAMGAAIDCGMTAESVAAALTRAFAQPDAEWSAMSQAASSLAETRFSQAVVAKAWRETYARLLSENP